MAIEFVPAAGQYRDTSTKKFVPRATVLMTMETEVSKMRTSLKGIGRLLLSGKIDLEEFQERMADRVKQGAIQAAMIGTGGQARTNQAVIAPLEQRLRNRHGHLRNFAQDIRDGNIKSDKQFLARVEQYAEVYRASFHDGERRMRNQLGFNQAKRFLDPAAQHCAECLLYDTKGKWLPASEVIPPGTLCTCHGRCRCTVIYRRFVNPSLTRDILEVQ